MLAWKGGVVFIKETFKTLQGEGFWTGRPAVFCRFGRCNLWNGKEEDRHRAVCSFCDTDFETVEELDPLAVVERIEGLWRGDYAHRMVVLTGGEPALQIDDGFVAALKARGFYVAIETNGTRPLPSNLDWICVSPKILRIRVREGNELKLVYPQERVEPGMFNHLAFEHFWLSPMDRGHIPGDDPYGEKLKQNTEAAIAYCLSHPQWRLNIQTHKVLDIR